MKCLNCQNEMVNLQNTHFCWTENCDISEFIQYSPDTYYWTFRFQKELPDITVQTGQINGQPQTVIKHIYDDEITMEKIILRFNQEILNMNVEKLKTYLTFM